MKEIFPDLLRAIVTDMMLILLLITMTRPKYKSKLVYILATMLILTLNISGNVYFYLSKNYSDVVLMDLAMLLVMVIVLKPLFSYNLMKWCFSFITMLNIYGAVVFLSYILCDFFPYPIYANTVLRFLLFGVIILLFQKKLAPLYRRVADNWHIYFLPTLLLCVNFIAYILGGDITEKLSQNAQSLLLLVALGITIYITIMNSLNSVTRQYVVREENLKLQNHQHLLRQSAQSMEQRLTLMNESARQMSIINHDHKHLNNALQELLEQGKTEEALSMLKDQQTFTTNVAPLSYCENAAANASIGYYAALARREDITCDIRTQIPTEIKFDSLELSMVLSNLMENAINACATLLKEEKRYIFMTVICDEQLIIETENSYEKEIILDENGYPTSQNEGHGIGTKSILAFAKRYNGEVIYKIADGIFNVRIIA